MNDHDEWKRRTALSYRERKADEARQHGAAMSDRALDQLAAGYVGASAEQVQRWRSGRP